MYNQLVTKVNAFHTKVPSTSGLASNTQYITEKKS